MKLPVWSWVVLPLSLAVFLITADSCRKKEKEPEVPNDVWDIDQQGIPKMAGQYIDLNRIYRISKYRSGIGHDYSDFSEQCRSLKHYFQPWDTTDWSTVKVYAPVTGKVTRFEQEWTGVKIEMESRDYPAFRFVVFHVNPKAPMNIGDAVAEGQLLGTHIGSATMSDIAVIVNDPTKRGRMVSYFSVIRDDVFADYQARGVAARDSMIIPKSIRDAHPLTCNGDQFQDSGTVANWIYLR